MTLTINGVVGAPAGVELEVTEVVDGIEQYRYRVGNNCTFRFAVLASVTMMMREVVIDAVSGGGHGKLMAAQAMADVDAALTAAGAVPAGFEDGDVEPEVLALGQQIFDAQERALHVLGQFLACEGELVQIDIYDELVQAYEAYADAVAAMHAHEESISGAA